MTVLAANLGFPRMGPQRELKKSLESYWAGKISAGELEVAAAGLRERSWRLQAALGIDHIPSGEFSLYDHVLDTAVLVGAAPERYETGPGPGPLERYFAMARGGTLAGRSVTALEMTKWFDTNYHYLVPELRKGQRFALSSTKPVDELREAAALGIATRPVVLGPVSFLLLSRRVDGGGTNLDLLPQLCEVYAEVLESLYSAGATWVQVDEPVLGLDLDPAGRAAFGAAYAALREAAPRLRLLVATYFAGLGDNLATALSLPIDALHLDAVADPGQVEVAVARAPATLALSLGVVDGRNVWRTDLSVVLARLEASLSALGPDRLLVAPSCSLLHLPFDLGLEPALDPELRSWLAFATQRLEEVQALVRGLNEGREAVEDELRAASAACASRAGSARVHSADIARRMAEHTLDLERRSSPYPDRRHAQARHLGLPVLPTTTIGSFPQTPAVRSLRAQYRQGIASTTAYEEGMKAYIDDAIAFQEQVGLDVLVHGEPERNDMVEYFGDLLDGCAVTTNGWVQSYGSRCVKPPIIWGDIRRTGPMTVKWAAYAQSRTERPVKGMLTGPITILQWSFVRNDQPRKTTARQLAFAIRDEVADLEAAGIKVIQIDEPALREGLPLHTAERQEYLAWAVGAFRLASSGVGDETQVHTHMCYGKFNDIIESIAAFDADVISIEASRSQMKLLGAFTNFEYPNEIGPGIWDIHSPRVPETAEMVELLTAALAVVPAERLWVNPDCGLKTRAWDEVRPALANLVAAAREARQLPEPTGAGARSRPGWEGAGT
jgi:5-methyltetrahydropteroyltriglutamate--homocysteine methyltransferase